MYTSATVKIAVNAIGVNKMRSGLTMLGIIIGVASVIAMMSVGAGAKIRISKEIASLGSNLLMGLSGAATSGGLRMGFGTAPPLTVDDARAIAAGIGKIVYGNQNWNTIITGTIPVFFELREWPLISGKIFTERDVDAATKVAVLGQTVVENLFGNEDPLDKVIRIKKIPFRIIGVLSRKGQSPTGQDQDDIIYVPVTTAQKRLFGTLFPGTVRMLIVKAISPDALKNVEKYIE